MALVVVMGLVGLWVVRRGNPVSLEIDGEPIANAADVLVEAEAAFTQLATEDAAHPPDGAGCWFAPPAADTAGRRGLADRPRIACGPVRLGVSGQDKVWVTGTATFTPSGVSAGREMVGRFGELRGVEALDAGDLVRPDGREPPGTGDLPQPDPVLRNREGQRLLREQEVLANVERGLRPAADRGRATIARDAACWYGLTPDTARNTSDGYLWCGPVMTGTSSPGEHWARVTLTEQRGDSFVTAEMRTSPLSSIAGTHALPAGTRLHRPDGRPAPTDVDLEAPASPSQTASGVRVLSDVPAGLDLPAPAGDARLVTPERRIELVGVGRRPRVGTGRNAVVAVPGEELVVARYTRADAGRTTGAARGSAQVDVGGRRSAVPGWGFLPAEGVLVVPVPVGTDAVLEVVFDGVTQTISLSTGQRGPGAPPALYRRSNEVRVDRPVNVTVPLPAGPAATATGTVGTVRVEAWRERLGWAPPGKAFVIVAVDDWSVSRPCCALTKVDTMAIWALALRDGTVLPARPSGPGDAGTVVFEAPDTVTSAEIRLSLGVSFEQQPGTPATASGGPIAVPVELPA